MLDVPWGDLIPFIAIGIVVADGSVAIRGDLSGFHRDLKAAEGETRTFGQRIKDVLSPRNIIGAAGIFGIGLGVRQLVGYAGEAADAFSNLQQTTRTVDAVFGRSARVIHDWGETAAEAAGLSKREVNEAAAVMGQTLLNMGFNASEAADRVVHLQQRAADLALAFGKAPGDAILAITAAMRGERDTIEKFGISIKQADVNSRVLALGLDTSTSSAKKNAEAIAILDIILNQSASSAGRFATSTDDIAVKLAKQQAQIENFNTVIGQEIASIQLGAVKIGDAVTSYFDTASGNIDAFTMNFGAQHVEILRLADEAGITYEQMKQRIIAAMDLTGLSFPDVVAQFEMEGSIGDLVEEQYQDAALAAGAGVAAMANQIALGGPVVAKEAGKVAGMFPDEIRRRDAEIRRAGMNNVVEFAAGMIDKQNDPLLAMEALAKANEEVLTRSAEITRLLGALHSTELAAGLSDGRPAVRLAAQAAAAEIEARLRELGAWQWGYNAGAAFAAGLSASIPEIYRAAAGAASATGSQIGIRSEPEDHNSPLYGITKWGGNLVKTFAGGIFNELGTASAAGIALAGALVPSVPNPTWSSTPGSPMAAGGTVQYILNVEGLPVVIGSAEDVMARWRQLTSLSKEGVQ